jgi:PilZ domain-containing protein
MPDRHRSPRALIALPCTLRRRIGSPIVAQTVEVGPEGMCVSSPRPLAADETVTFDLPDLDIRITGSARVLRQQRHNVYVLRFEQLPAPMVNRLHALAINRR